MSITDFNVTNTAVFKIKSAGSAYTLTLPFEPTMVEWWNYTKYGTDTNNIQGVWVEGFPGGDAVIVTRGTTTLTSTLETTNGVTDTTVVPNFTANQLPIPTVISKASPCVVTIDGHGLTTNQFVRAAGFLSQPAALATGMYQLNNQLFQVKVLTADTFALYYPHTGLPVDSTGYTTFVSQGDPSFTLVGESLNTQNPEPTFTVLLGSAVMGNASDLIYVRATLANAYTDLGQV